VTCVGDFHGGDRGWSATRARHSREEKKGNRVGADRGEAVARGRRTAERCGMGQWSSSVSVGRARARVLTMNTLARVLILVNF
jgi:hypothetical protein